MKRRFELVDGATAKFWEIELAGVAHTVRYGRLGAKGQEKTKTFPSVEEAEKSASKLIGQKTRKGYAEVSGESAKPNATSTPAPTAASHEQKAKTTSSRAKGTVKLPALELGSTKYGARMMAGRAAKLMALETPDALRQEGWRITDKFPAHHLPDILTHLVEHGALSPTSTLGGYLLENLRPEALSRERLLHFLQQLDALTLRAWPEAVQRAVLWLHAKSPTEDLANLELGPAAKDAVELFCGLALGETLSPERASAAMRALVAPMHRGRKAGLYAGPVGDFSSWTFQALDEEALARKLVELGGERWLDRLDHESAGRLPWEVLAPAVAGRPLASLTWLLGQLKDVPLLEASHEPASEFFALANELVSRQPTAVGVLRVAGMARATSPQEIPAELESALHPSDFRVYGALGTRALAALGTTRLGRWALDELESLDVLRSLWLRGVPFGDEVVSRLLTFDELTCDSATERWARDAMNDRGTPSGLERCLPIVVKAATEAEGRTALALRRWVAVIVANYPEDAPIPRECDALLEPDQIAHVSNFGPTIRALAKLPPDRAERVLWRAAPGFAKAPAGDDVTEEPYRELRFFRPRLSRRYLERVGDVLLEYRDDDMMWSDINHTSRNFKREGARLAEALATRMAGETVSQTLLDRVRSHLGDEAAERIAEVAGRTESVRDELGRIARDLPGSKRPIYVLWPTEDAATDESVAYTGGLPAGFTKDTLPKAGTRALIHAFTLRLSALPELQASLPEAVTLSIFVQAYSEEVTRAHALLPRSTAQLEDEPGDLSHARAVEIQRLDVPEQLFDEPDDPAQGGALTHLRGLIFRQAGHVLGGPLWLQDGPAGQDARFVCQFDERLADINLGDSGVAYAFDHECVWQCH